MTIATINRETATQKPAVRARAFRDKAKNEGPTSMAKASIDPVYQLLDVRHANRAHALRGSPGWKKLMAAGVLLLATACATPAPSIGSVPVDIVQGELVELWGVSSARVTAGVEVRGSVTRPRGPNRPFNEHLHAETINESGAILEAREVPWNSIASLRTRHSATFSTTFASPNGDAIARVRLKVVAGAVHFSD